MAKPILKASQDRLLNNYYHALPTLLEEKPDIVIIHRGITTSYPQEKTRRLIMKLRKKILKMGIDLYEAWCLKKFLYQVLLYANELIQIELIESMKCLEMNARKMVSLSLTTMI